MTLARHTAPRELSPTVASRLSVRDLLDEAVASIAARPARLVFTALGTALGIAAVVTTIGLAQTAAGQVGQQFDAIAATQLVVVPDTETRPGSSQPQPMAQLPWDAPDRASRLAGVVAAGTYATVDIEDARLRSVPVIDPTTPSGHTVPIIAALPGLLDAVRGSLRTGRFFDHGHDARADRVAVIGIHAAERLHISRIDTQPSIFLDNDTYAVIGILDDVARRTELLDAVILPNGTAQQRYGLSSPDELHIRTQTGAADQVGAQAPIALHPNRPEAFDARVPPSAGIVRERVQADINVLFVALGAVALLVGALGIANVTLLSVLERIPEIGLRRALGATRRHISAQILLESCTIGLLGGLVGAATGVLTVVGVSLARDWTPLLDPTTTLSPILGGAIGLIAGAYPARKAGRVEPITALRSDG